MASTLQPLLDAVTAFCSLAPPWGNPRKGEMLEAMRGALAVYRGDPLGWMQRAAEVPTDRPTGARVPIICDGCNVRAPFEHRCHEGRARVGDEPAGGPCECKMCEPPSAAEMAAFIAQTERDLATPGDLPVIVIGHDLPVISPARAPDGVAAVPGADGLWTACSDHCPSGFRGRWQDWHRGSGCSRDDGKPRTKDGKAEIAALGWDHKPDAARRLLRTLPPEELAKFKPPTDEQIDAAIEAGRRDVRILRGEEAVPVLAESFIHEAHCDPDRCGDMPYPCFCKCHDRPPCCECGARAGTTHGPECGNSNP